MGAAPPRATLTCSQRMEAVIGAISRKAIVRCGVIQGLRLYQLVANPKHAEDKKTSNKGGNEWKKQLMEEGKQAMRDSVRDVTFMDDDAVDAEDGPSLDVVQAHNSAKVE